MSTYSFEYQKVALSDLPEADRALCRQAVSATKGSYSPYSDYKVGAAVRLDNGQVVSGANQENASYPCGTCAERTALNYAQANWPQARVEAIAIAADGALPSPCGLCRQALAEVEQRQQSPMRLLLVSGNDVVLFSSAGCLLPFAFGTAEPETAK